MASALANSMQPHFNGGLPAYLMQMDLNDTVKSLKSFEFWLNFLREIQQVKGNKTQVVEATGYRGVYVGGLFWALFLPSVALLMMVAYFIFKPYLLSYCPQLYRRHQCKRQTSVTGLLSITILLTLCILVATITIFFYSINSGHKVHESLANYEKPDSKRNSKEIGNAFKTSAGYLQFFLANGLKELKDNVKQTLTTSTTSFEKIVINQVKVFSIELLNNYGVTDSFQSASNLFTNFDKVLSAMQAIKRFQDLVLKDLNAFGGGISAINFAINNCCGNTLFCAKLSKEAEKIFCERTMRDLPLMKMGIDGQKLNFDNGASLLSMLLKFNIDVSKLERDFKMGEAQVDQMLQNVFGEVKKNFNWASISDNILPFIEKAENASIPFNATLHNLKMDGIDSTMSMVHDYWYTAFSIISCVHFLAICCCTIIVLYFLHQFVNKIFWFHHRFENDSKSSSKSSPTETDSGVVLATAGIISGDKLSASPYDIDFYLLEYHLSSNTSDKSSFTFSTTSFESSPYAIPSSNVHRQEITAHKDVHLRQTSYRKAISESPDLLLPSCFPNKPDSISPSLTYTKGIQSNLFHSSSPRSSVFVMFLLSFAFFTMVPCIFSSINFYLAASVHTEICRYLNTEPGVVQTDVKLDTFINQSLAPVFVNIRNVGDFTLNLRAPKHVLSALYDKCSDTNVTLLKQLEMYDLIDVDSLMQSKMLADILEKGRLIAVDKIKDLNVDQLIPISTKTVLNDAKRVSEMFIDNINYNASLTELQKPFILLPRDLSEYLLQLSNVSKSILMELPSDKEATLLQLLVESLQSDQLLTYQRLKTNLFDLENDFGTLQNTRVITHLIDNLQECLSRAMQLLQNSSQVELVLNNAYNKVIMKSAVYQIGQSLRMNLGHLEQQLVTCQPLFLAYQSLIGTICDVAIPHLLNYSTLYALAVIFLQISLCLAVLIILIINHHRHEDASQC